MTESPYETRRLAGADGVRLAVDVWRRDESRPPLRPGFLLVHGLASNARLYDGVARRLAAAGHCVAGIDLRGHGRSDKPEDGYDYRTMCADLAAVLESLARPGSSPGAPGFERPVVVGQSFGGNLVLELAARHGELVSGVACIDGGTIDLSARFPTWEEVSSVLAPPKLAGTPRAELEGGIAAMHPDWPREGIDATLANFETRPDGTIAPWLTLERHLAILRTMWESSPLEAYPRIHVPVLLLPADSPGAPEAWTEAKRHGIEEALGTLETARAHWFSPADHDVHAQHPEQVAAVLEAAVADGFFRG